jgi:hypothetical protein
VPCSIWIPPEASGPVFTVSSPIFTGLFWANAGNGHAAATAAVPTRNDLRSIRVAVIDKTPFDLLAPRQLEGRRLVGHAPADRDIA